MTKSGETRRCRACGREFALRAGPGRPQVFCRQVCRQRDYEARQRAAEVGLSESELVVARHELDELYDLLYVLECAVEDVQRDVTTKSTNQELHDALNWLLQAATPLVGRRLGHSW